MGQLSENAYRLAYYLYYRARKAPLDEDGNFLVRVEDIIQYIGLPTKEEVKNRNYDEAVSYTHLRRECRSPAPDRRARPL